MKSIKVSKETAKVVLKQLKKNKKVRAAFELQKIAASNSLMGIKESIPAAAPVSTKPRATKPRATTRRRGTRKTTEESKTAILKLKDALRTNGPMTMPQLTRVLCPHGIKSGRKYRREYGFIDNHVLQGTFTKEDGLVTPYQVPSYSFK
ncbi:MAG TPA: hypothetical protein VMW10_00785 [Alphaproteobacteria bacterium]|nr:hypothetical protein [Alphaproteobacteria bacterium]